VFDHSKGRSVLLKERKDQTHRSLDLFIGIQHHLPRGIIDQSHGQAKSQFPLFGFRQLASQEPLPQPVKLRLAHGALEAEQEPIIVVTGIIDAFFINDERLGESTNLQEVIPIATGTSQTRHFQTQDGSAMLEPDFSDQGLKPISTNGRGARVPLVLINDTNALSRPAQAEAHVAPDRIGAWCWRCCRALASTKIAARRSRHLGPDGQAGSC
jgi:hypothetical protein